jgi:hypothetical protein
MTGPVVSAAIVGNILHDVKFGAVKGVKTWRLAAQDTEENWSHTLNVCSLGLYALILAVGCELYIPHFRVLRSPPKYVRPGRGLKLSSKFLQI